MLTGDIMTDCSLIYNYLEDIPLRTGTYRRTTFGKEGASVLYGDNWKGFLKYDSDGNKVMREKSSTPGRYNTKIKTEHPYLMDIFKEFRDHYFPDFKFNQVQINKNFSMKKHLDSRNVGKSYLVSFGDYTGGKTRVYRDNGYTDLDSNCNPVTFDGSKYYHEVLPFSGTRYSLVFFHQ